MDLALLEGAAAALTFQWTSLWPTPEYGIRTVQVARASSTQRDDIVILDDTWARSR